MFSAINLSMRFGGKILFQNASFQLLPKCHYGLIGPNGAGKSTLLKILIGDLSSDGGEVAISSYQKIGALKQDHFIYEDCKILDVVLMGKPKLWAALQAKERLFEIEDFTDVHCDELAIHEKIIEELDGYAAESNSAQLLEGLGIPTSLHTNLLKSLSGGYKLRVLLAQLLFSSPDVLLLDEPTNHLDIFSIRWLEEYLKNFPGTLLVSSHDRQFLNAICNYIIDLDYGTANTYKGNYDDFEKTKAEARVFKEAMIAKQDKRKEEMEEFVERFKAKASKARQAQSRMKAIEKLEESMEELRPSSRRYPNFNFNICRSSGARVLKVDEIGKSYGNKHVLNNISFEIERGERVAFVGANGIGKSTILEILTGQQKTDRGQFEWGFAAHHAYFPQDHLREVNGKYTLLDWLGQFDTMANREHLQQILAKSLFSGDEVKKLVNILSGGETARLILAKMMLVKHNVLIFDEPTNHLDMEATEMLIQALENYQGTILFVSHNRYFVTKLATRVIEMTTNGIKDFKCSFNEYLEKSETDLLDARKAMRSAANQIQVTIPKDDQPNQTNEKKKQKNLGQLQRKLEVAEKRCIELEQSIQEIDEKVCDPQFYIAATKQEQKAILSQKEDLQLELKSAYAEWERYSQETP